MGWFSGKKEKRPGSGCPEPMLIARVCACIDCPKRGICFLERACRHTDCSNYIRTCSLKSFLFGRLSDFADNLSDLYAQKLMQEIIKQKRVVVEYASNENEGTSKRGSIE